MLFHSLVQEPSGTRCSVSSVLKAMKEVQPAPEGTGSQAGGPSGIEGGHILGPFGGQKGSAAGAVGLGGEGVQQLGRRQITWSFRPQKAFGFCFIPQVRWKVTGSFPLTALGQGC